MLSNKQAIKRIIIDTTPNNTIRVWLYFNGRFDLNLNEVVDFNAMAIDSTIHSFDTSDEKYHLMSWELPISTAGWLRDRFTTKACEYEVVNHFETMRKSEVFALMIAVIPRDNVHSYI